MSFFKRLMFAIFGNWSAAFAVGIVSVGAATVIAIMAYAEFQQLKSGKDDARWSVFGLSNILSVKSNRRLEGCDPVSC